MFYIKIYKLYKNIQTIKKYTTYKNIQTIKKIYNL